MSEHEIAVETQDGVTTTFVAHPDDGGPFPVAFLYHDGIGYREQVKENARRFAAAGYFVVVPDLFYREGEKISFDLMRTRTDEAYRAELMRVVTSVTPQGAMGDTDAVLERISGHAAAAEGPMVCVGYCMGARLALHAAEAKADEFAAAACIHPGKLATDGLARIRGEVLVAFAEVDQSVTAEDVDEFRRAFDAQGVDGAVERWPGTHGFAMADLPMYDEPASERHFARTIELWRGALSRERAVP